jgi:UDP-glucose 4-epimerase
VVQRLEKQALQVVVLDNRTSYGIIPHDELDYLMQQRMARLSTPHIIDGDIEDGYVVSWAMERFKPQTVIHLASFPRQKVVNANPQLGSRAMSEGLINLLEHSKRHGVQKFVYISSSMVYGDFQDQVREDSPCCPQGQYGIMKLAGEWLVRDYHRRGCFDYSIIRPSAVYGPLDVEDRVISKFLLTAMRGGTITVNGANETLDFTYVDDAADGIVAAAVLPSGSNRTFNITKSHSKTLLEAAELAVQLVGKGTIEVRDRDLDFPSRGALNIDAAREHLKFDPKIDIEQGFQRYYDWLSQSSYWLGQLLK